jgi:hypothetical protein
VCPICAFRALIEETHPETVELPVQPASATPPAIAGLKFEHYQVLIREDGTPFELGRGGMGVTYKAIDINLRSVVALKVINPRFIADELVRRRFVREARAAASIRHPNVASVFHLGQSGDSFFYAMEFVKGEPLDRALARIGRFEPAVWLKALPWRKRRLRRSRYKEFFWVHPLTPVRNNLPDSAPIFVPIFIHSVSRSGRCFRVNRHFKVLGRN